MKTNSKKYAIIIIDFVSFNRMILFYWKECYIFSEYFEVNIDDLQKYGAIDISLVADIPMFIDPILIFNID